MLNENPYASPVDTSDGNYDWSLAKRIVYSFLAVALIGAICAFGIISQYRSAIWSRQVQYTSPAEQIKELFLGDWFKETR